MNESLDRWGALASSVCAVHCALAALLPVALSALGLSLLIGHEAEWLLTIIAISFALGALVFSRRQAPSPVVTGLLVFGILGLLASRGLEMTSGHHHESEHSAAVEKTSHPNHDVDEHAHEHHHESEASHTHETHAEGMHLAGTAVGVLAGLFLFAGHLLRLRIARRERKDCC